MNFDSDSNPHLNPSTLSLQSTTEFCSSITPLNQSQKQKGYSTAFGALLCMCGTSGTTPKPLRPTNAKTTHPSSSSMPPPHAPRQHQRAEKDFEAAFAALSSSYGYGGQIPTLPRENKDKDQLKKAARSSFVLRGWSYPWPLAKLRYSRADIVVFSVGLKKVIE